MNERIKKLRKQLHLTQDEFGNKLGVANSSISNIEKNRYGITDQMIKLMVKEFGVNENWLRTGEGEMFPEFDRANAIAEHVAQIIKENPSSFKSRFISFLIKMTDEQWNFFENLLCNFLRSENYE